MAGIKDFFKGFGFGEALDSVGNLVGAIGNMVSSKKNRETNEKLTRETNENNRKMQESANATNMQIADNANALQREESEKAYERSKAGNQVNLMTQAGMSRAGAINALNGGGSYTPAPVNTAQVEASKDEAPQGNPTDFSGLIGAFSSLASNQAQYRLTMAQLKQQNEQFKMEQDLKERQFAEEQVNNKVARELTGKEIEIAAERLHLTEAQTKKVLADTDLTVAQLQTEIAKYGLTMAQVAEVQERTKLTTAQILQVKAATKLTEQQVFTEIERTGLTHQQAVTAAKQFEHIAMQVDEFTRFDSVQQRCDAQKLNAQILQFARDIKMDERDISAMEKEIKQGDYYMETFPVSQLLRAWEYVLTHAVPLRGLFGGK
ncbi:MAG: hypothetical protein [Microviridae sp.]|nr:MAG: hypothetical protein [Microviridae sp.]